MSSNAGASVEVGQVVEVTRPSEPDSPVISLLVRDLVPDLGGWGKPGLRGRRLEYRAGAGSLVSCFDEDVLSVRPGTPADEWAAENGRVLVAEDDRRVLEAAHRFTRDYPSAAEVMERDG